MSVRGRGRIYIPPRAHVRPPLATGILQLWYSYRSRCARGTPGVNGSRPPTAGGFPLYAGSGAAVGQRGVLRLFHQTKKPQSSSSNASATGTSASAKCSCCAAKSELERDALLAGWCDGLEYELVAVDDTEEYVELVRADVEAVSPAAFVAVDAEVPESALGS